MTDVVFPDPVKDYRECAALCADGRECQNHGRYVFHHRLLGEQYLCRMHFRSACNSPYRVTDTPDARTTGEEEL